MRAKIIHWPLLTATVLITALMLWAAIVRIRVDTDVVSSLPKDHGVLSDAVYIFKNHPIQNQIAIDMALDRVDQDLLVRLAETVEQRLQASGMFAKVGTHDMQQIIPQLIAHVTDHLPFLFSARELNTQVEPLLRQASVENRLRQLHQDLMGFSAIGQAGFLARDPLGLRDLKLAALSALAPSQHAKIYKGKLVSSDGRHLMILAQPTGSGTDTAFARKLTDLIQQVDRFVIQAQLIAAQQGYF